MTKQEKGQIELLRASGYSYGEIAKVLMLTKSSVTNYCLRQQIVSPGYIVKVYSLCPNCRKLFSPSGSQRNNQRFCSTKCRSDYWRKEHLNQRAMDMDADFHQTLQKELDLFHKKSDEWLDDEEVATKQLTLTNKGGIDGTRQ